MKRSTFNLVWALALTALSACSPAIPPQELVDAREAYRKASEGPASQVSPVSLDDARIALDEAEDAYRKDPESIATRDLSYVALRQSEIAASSGNRALAVRLRQRAVRDRERLRRTRQERMEAELSQARAQLGNTQSELEKERTARASAESKLAAAMASLEEIAKVKEESRGLVITLSGAVLFASGKSELLPIAQQKLTQVAQTLKDEAEGRKIVVEGHTDSRGSSRRNQELSLSRANSVRSHLVSQGVNTGLISAVGLGEDRPVANNRTAEGRANNRRVEIIVQPET